MKKNYLNNLTVFATLAVLALHTASSYHYGYQPKPYWYYGLFRQSIYIWCVPIFFMITGAKLLGFREKYGLKIYFIKRLPVLVSFILWQLIYVLLWINYRDGEINSVYHFVNLFTQVSEISSVNPYFWYFPSLFEVYLMIPLFSQLSKDKNLLLYGIVLAYLSANILPKLSTLSGVNIQYFKLGFGYIFYVLLGYYVDSIEIEKKNRKRIYVLGVIAAFVKFAFTAAHSYLINENSMLLSNYFNITTLLQTLAVFVYVKNSKQLNTGKISLILSKLSEYCFGVYLVQYGIIRYFLYENLNQSSIKVMIVQFPLAIISSFLVTYLIKKIPKIGKILIP